MKAFDKDLKQCYFIQNKRDSALSVFLCDLQLALRDNNPEYLKQALNNFPAALSETITGSEEPQLKVLNEIDDFNLYELMNIAYRELTQISRESATDSFTEAQQQNIKNIEKRLSDAFPIAH